MLGVLACPNLPFHSIIHSYQNSSARQFGCLFYATIGAGTRMQLLNDSSSVTKVIIFLYELLLCDAYAYEK